MGGSDHCCLFQSSRFRRINKLDRDYSCILAKFITCSPPHISRDIVFILSTLNAKMEGVAVNKVYLTKGTGAAFILLRLVVSFSFLKMKTTADKRSHYLFLFQIFFLFALRMASTKGPLQTAVTWYKKQLAGWQTTQRGKKNREITSFRKLIYFLFKVPLRRLPSGKVFFLYTMWPYSAKGPIDPAF